MFSLAFEEDPCLAEDPAVNSQKISESCRAPAGCSSLPNPRGANPLPPEPKVLVLDGLRIFQHVHRRGTAARVYKATPSELEPRVEESVCFAQPSGHDLKRIRYSRGTWSINADRGRLLEASVSTPREREQP